MMQTNGTSRETLSTGYRMDSIEWSGWGTFHHHWKMHLGGETTLLTGENGSGKSTILDMILTLLIPTVGRNYNQAAGGKKTDRSVETYLLGRYATVSTGNSTKDEELRERDGYHVLIAVFKNYPLNQTITLAHVYWWSNNTLQSPIYLVSEQHLTFREHFQFTDGKHIRKALQQLPDTTIHQTFSAYAEHFRRLFHMGEKAQDLINQIVAIKEIPELDEFVRQNMLEAFDTRSAIERLRDKFRDLDDIHEKIKSAEDQERVLRPMIRNNQQYQENVTQLNHIRERLGAAPIFFADQRIQLLQLAMDKLEKQMESYWQQIEIYDTQLNDLRSEESSIKAALSQNSVQREIDAISLELKALDTALKYKQNASKDYHLFVAPLNLPEVLNKETFEKNKVAILNKQNQIDEQSTNLQKQVNEFGATGNLLQSEHNLLNEEINSLQGRKTQVDLAFVMIRDEISKALDIKTEYLPYVGELLQVREEAADWESVLQLLLRDFALKLLVPDKYFTEVSRYINANNLKNRLDYEHIIKPISIPTNLDVRSIYHKLEVKPDNLFGTNVIAGFLANHFGDYVACETLEEFHEHNGRAITRNRHIKRSRTGYTKDDRPHIIDPTKYRLGWNNTQKLESLKEKRHEIKEQIQSIQKEIEILSAKQKKLQNDIVAIGRLLSFNDFSEIDWYSIDKQSEAMRKRQDQLKHSNNAYLQLEQQFEAKQLEIQQLVQKRDETSRDSAKLEGEWEAYSASLESDNNRYPLDLRESKTDILKTIADDIQEKISLKNEREIQEGYEAHLRKEEGSRFEENNRLIGLISRRMQDYNNQFHDIAVDLVPDVKSIHEYLDRHKYIVEQDLPKHKTSFNDLLRRHVGDEISSFKASLEARYDEYKRRIEGLNSSLAQIVYNKHKRTYIQLKDRRANNSEIQAFKRELEQCIPDPGAEQDGIDEHQYGLIRKLIEKLFDITQQRWRNLVTDVRNWLDIYAEEYEIQTHKSVYVYESSSGKSGGQKAKLAYTILASAVAYQYGLHDEWHRDERFRFVMVDEVFSKSDEQNSHYAMELFKTLHLQVLVVTPSDKMHIVLPYIGTCCIVANPNQDNSKLATMRIHNMDEFREHAEKGTIEAYVTRHAQQD